MMPIGSFADTGKVENEVIVLTRALLEIEEITLNYGDDPNNPAPYDVKKEQRRQSPLYRAPQHQRCGEDRRRLRRGGIRRQEVLRQVLPEAQQGQRRLGDRREL